MSKSTKTPTAKSTLTREQLTTELERIRTARITEEKSFRERLESLYAEHRKTMRTLSAARASAWAKYSKPETKAEAKPLRKAAAKKPAPAATAEAK